MDVIKRIERLERENRMLKRLVVMVFLGIAVVFSTGAYYQDSIPDVIKAKRIELVDGDGNVRAFLGETSPDDMHDEIGYALVNKDGEMLSRWYILATKNVSFNVASVDKIPLLSLGSNGSTSDGTMAGNIRLWNKSQDSSIVIGRTGPTNGTGIHMEQSNGMGGGRVVSTWSFYKNKSSSLTLGDGIELEQARLGAPHDKPCFLQLGDKAFITGGGQ